jgi:hypothetical protein
VDKSLQVFEITIEILKTTFPQEKTFRKKTDRGREPLKTGLSVICAKHFFWKRWLMFVVLCPVLTPLFLVKLFFKMYTYYVFIRAMKR